MGVKRQWSLPLKRKTAQCGTTQVKCTAFMYTHRSMWFGTQLSWFFLSSWKLLFHCQPHTKIVSQPRSPSPTVAERSESDKHMERVQCKLTPCFRLSLAWSATSDTITKAAATQTERGRQKIKNKRREDLCAAEFQWRHSQRLWVNSWGAW